MLRDITHSCGHEIEHQVRGPWSGHEYQVQQLSAQPCDACRVAARDKDNARALEAAREAGIPELVGSEKQVAWAAKIREKALKTIGTVVSTAVEKYVAQAVSEGATDEQITLVHARISEWVTQQRSITNAGKWIDSRDNWTERDVQRRLITIVRAVVPAAPAAAA